MLEARERLGLSQPLAAELCGIPVWVYYRLESLKYPVKYMEEVILKVSSGLGIPPDDIMPVEMAGVSVPNKKVEVAEVSVNRMLAFVERGERLLLPSPETQAQNNDDIDLLLQFVTELPNRHQEVVLLRYGLKDGQCYTYLEIEKSLNVKKDRIRQIEAESLRKLREIYQRHGHYFP